MSKLPVSRLTLLSLMTFSALVSSHPTRADGDASRIWSYGVFEDGVGQTGMVVLPREDGPGNQIITGTSRPTSGGLHFWVALEYSLETGHFEHGFVSEPYATRLGWLLAGDVVGDERPEVVVLSEWGYTLLYDHSTWERIGEFPTNSDIEAATLGDTDGDGKEEILILTDSDLEVFDGDGAMLWSEPASGFAVAAGQMDEDPTIEIVTGDGTIFDAVSRLVQWTIPSAREFAVRDIDGDGIEELVTGSTSSPIRAYDVDIQSEKWSIPKSVQHIVLDDIDDDGVIEVVVASVEVHAFDTETLVEEWEFDAPVSGFTALATGDVNEDGAVEVLFSSLNTSPHGSALFVLDPITLEIEAETPKLRGPLIGPARGDVDGDGDRDIVAVTSGSSGGDESGRILVFDGLDRHLVAISDPVAENDTAYLGTDDVRLRDVDQDGDAEILVAAHGDDGYVEIYDFDPVSGFERIFVNDDPAIRFRFQFVDANDVDGDGQLEIVTGNSRFIVLYDFATGAVEWTSLQMGVGPFVERIVCADSDGDGDNEILAQLEDGVIYVFDGATKYLETILVGNHRSLTVHSRAGTPPFLVTADSAGDLAAYQYDGSTYALRKTAPLGVAEFDGLTRVRTKAVFVGREGRLQVHVPPDLTEPQWVSEKYGSIFGTRTVIGGTRTFLAAGTYMIAEFEWNSGE